MNRERPKRLSRTLEFGQSAVVIEHGGFDRYPMVKLLTAAEGGQWIGWALAADVEPIPQASQEKSEEPKEGLLPPTE